MTTSRPKSITILAILMLVLALLSVTSTVISRAGFGRPNFAQGPNAQQGFPQNGAGNNFQPGANGQGGGNFQQGGNNNFQRGGGNGIFSLFRVARTVGIGGPVISYVGTGLSVIGILLSLLSAYGLWKQRKWALNLAMVLAIFFLLGALPSLFMGGGRAMSVFSITRSTLNVLTVLATLPVLAMGILPSVRDFVS
jgi:hypothetical protein